MSQALCFNDVTLIPVNHQNQIWIKASELARALGYARDTEAAARGVHVSTVIKEQLYEFFRQKNIKKK